MFGNKKIVDFSGDLGMDTVQKLVIEKKYEYFCGFDQNFGFSEFHF